MKIVISAVALAGALALGTVSASAQVDPYCDQYARDYAKSRAGGAADRRCGGGRHRRCAARQRARRQERHAPGRRGRRARRRRGRRLGLEEAVQRGLCGLHDVAAARSPSRLAQAVYLPPVGSKQWKQMCSQKYKSFNWDTGYYVAATTASTTSARCRSRRQPNPERNAPAGRLAGAFSVYAGSRAMQRSDIRRRRTCRPGGESGYRSAVGPGPRIAECRGCCSFAMRSRPGATLASPTSTGRCRRAAGGMPRQWPRRSTPRGSRPTASSARPRAAPGRRLPPSSPISPARDGSPIDRGSTTSAPSDYLAAIARSGERREHADGDRPQPGDPGDCAAARSATASPASPPSSPPSTRPGRWR